MIISSKLNLTRKWRSKTFDTIVGQDVSVRILKNSLFLDQIFPVYLFSGQRGCGKTSTARVFTAAINCMRLDLFRSLPKLNPVPCLTCSSCVAMEQGKHPDFTEIDAASHTGVDNIRQLIETTSFLPILGRKKIYLIDEVHMLSKAAFNALLKILEEPPISVIFILATTDPHKVIDTVRSRCFQLFFGPPKTELLLKHLQQVCETEKIKADPEALIILIRESEGSVRDAMNLLEQVRFIESHVTIETVERSLGYVSDLKLLKLLELILSNDLDLISFLNQLNLGSKNIDFIWRRFCELLKYVIYIKHGVKLEVDTGLKNVLAEIATKFELGLLVKFLGLVVGQEQILSKTTHKALVLELFFLQGASLDLIGNNNSGNSGFNKSENKSANLDNKNHEDQQALNNNLAQELLPEPIAINYQDAWQQFLGLICGCHDPILISIFKQAQFDGTSSDQVVKISFSDQGLFFKDLICEKKTLWQSYLKQVFGEKATLEINFVARPVQVNSEQLAGTELNQDHQDLKQAGAEVLNKHLDSSNIINRMMAGKRVDVSDQEKWPLANQILAHFPGQVYEVDHE
jgi:DNA polymerase III subunit gamma/tau